MLFIFFSQLTICKLKRFFLNDKPVQHETVIMFRSRLLAWSHQRTCVWLVNNWPTETTRTLLFTEIHLLYSSRKSTVKQYKGITFPSMCCLCSFSNMEIIAENKMRTSCSVTFFILPQNWQLQNAYHLNLKQHVILHEAVLSKSLYFFYVSAYSMENLVFLLKSVYVFTRWWQDKDWASPCETRLCQQ